MLKWVNLDDVKWMALDDARSWHWMLEMYYRPNPTVRKIVQAKVEVATIHQEICRTHREADAAALALLQAFREEHVAASKVTQAKHQWAIMDSLMTNMCNMENVPFDNTTIQRVASMTMNSYKQAVKDHSGTLTITGNIERGWLKAKDDLAEVSAVHHEKQAAVELLGETYQQTQEAVDCLFADNTNAMTAEDLLHLPPPSELTPVQVVLILTDFVYILYLFITMARLSFKGRWFDFWFRKFPSFFTALVCLEIFDLVDFNITWELVAIIVLVAVIDLGCIRRIIPRRSWFHPYLLFVIASWIAILSFIQYFYNQTLRSWVDQKCHVKSIPRHIDYHPTVDMLYFDCNLSLDAVVLKLELDKLAPLEIVNCQLECPTCVAPISLSVVIDPDNEYCPRKKEYMVTPCCHVFHAKCFNQWMERKRRCPMCHLKLPRYEMYETMAFAGTL